MPIGIEPVEGADGNHNLVRGEEHEKAQNESVERERERGEGREREREREETVERENERETYCVVCCAVCAIHASSSLHLCAIAVLNH